MGFGITQAVGPVHLSVSPAVIWDESFHFSVPVSSFKSCGAKETKETIAKINKAKSWFFEKNKQN